jgi:hypothetical protein
MISTLHIFTLYCKSPQHPIVFQKSGLLANVLFSNTYPAPKPQSRQRAKLFSNRRNWDSPTPHPQASVPPTTTPLRGEGHIR